MENSTTKKRKFTKSAWKVFDAETDKPVRDRDGCAWRDDDRFAAFRAAPMAGGGSPALRIEARGMLRAVSLHERRITRPWTPSFVELPLLRGEIVSRHLV